VVPRGRNLTSALGGEQPNSPPTAFTPEPVRPRVAGMKQVLLMIAVVALVGQSVLAADKKPLIADPIVEKAVREDPKKPTGELTEADLAKVTQLVLSATQITDAGLKDVAKLKNLKDLDLRAAQITDAGLKDIAKMQQLRRLRLNSTQITDAGLKDIAKLLKLEWLELGHFPTNTRITPEGAAELREALPKCEIKHTVAENEKKKMEEDEFKKTKALAEKGDSNAQYWLGSWYSSRNGVSNSINAYAWFYLAYSNGHPEAKKVLDIYEREMPYFISEDGRELSTKLIPSENNTTSDVRFNIGCSSIFVFFALLSWWVVCDGYAGKNKYIHIALQSMGVLFCVYLIFSGIFLLTGWSGFFDWSSADTTPPVRGPKGGLLILIAEFWPYIIMVTGGFSLVNYYLELKDLLKEEA
jgi:hypothetical protein